MKKYEMDLSDGKYLGHEICAFSGDRNVMWVIVWDGKYNYYLFDTGAPENVRRHKMNSMPQNRINPVRKNTEYYTIFDNAIKGMCKIICNNGKWVQFIKILR